MEHHSYLTDDATRLALSTCTLDVATTANQVVVTVVGELDMADADEVAKVLIDAAGSGRPIVRLELSGLTFADSSAIKAIILGAKAAEDHGIIYELVNPHARVHRLLQVTGLTNALAIVMEPTDQQGPNSL
jgi:anti-sigma B factor antagonist